MRTVETVETVESNCSRRDSRVDADTGPFRIRHVADRCQVAVSIYIQDGYIILYTYFVQMCVCVCVCVEGTDVWWTDQDAHMQAGSMQAMAGLSQRERTRRKGASSSTILVVVECSSNSGGY